MRVLESPKRHLRFGTVPESVDCWPRLDGLERSIWRSVPPAIFLQHPAHIELQRGGIELPRIGAPLPLSSMGWPWLNCSRLTTAPSAADANNTRERVFIVVRCKQSGYFFSRTTWRDIEAYIHVPAGQIPGTNGHKCTISHAHHSASRSRIHRKCNNDSRACSAIPRAQTLGEMSRFLGSEVYSVSIGAAWGALVEWCHSRIRLLNSTCSMRAGGGLAVRRKPRSLYVGLGGKDCCWGAFVVLL
jgi:hypothetical protein